MKDRIPEFLQEKLNMRGYTKTSNFPDEIKKFMIDYANYYQWSQGDDFKKIFQLMKRGITTLPKCEYQDCNNIVKLTKELIIPCGCCKEHSQKITNLKKYGVEWNIASKNNRDKTKKTNLTKYGCENPMQHKEIQEKHQSSIIEKYGVDNVSKLDETLRKKMMNNLNKYGVYYTTQVEEVKDAIKKTNLERYGVDNVFKADSIKEKISKTNIEKYGVENFSQTLTFSEMQPTIKEKVKRTNLIKYGVDHPSKSIVIQQQVKNRNLVKYGVDHPMKLPDICEKQQKKMFKYKKYIWKTGEISHVQGYEDIILNELECSGFTFDEVKTRKKDMPEIWYEFEGSIHRYFPDFYIPKTNVIIEAKSEWTLKLHWEKNQAKFSAAKNAGFDFKLEVR